MDCIPIIGKYNFQPYYGGLGGIQMFSPLVVPETGNYLVNLVINWQNFARVGLQLKFAFRIRL